MHDQEAAAIRRRSTPPAPAAGQTRKGMSAVGPSARRPLCRQRDRKPDDVELSKPVSPRRRSRRACREDSRAHRRRCRAPVHRRAVDIRQPFNTLAARPKREQTAAVDARLPCATTIQALSGSRFCGGHPDDAAAVTHRQDHREVVIPAAFAAPAASSTAAARRSQAICWRSGGAWPTATVSRTRHPRRR
jgi:hypothetical protein